MKAFHSRQFAKSHQPMCGDPVTAGRQCQTSNYLTPLIDRQLDAGIFQKLFDAVLLGRACGNQIGTGAGQIPQQQ